MDIANVKWELKILLEHKNALALVGRELKYDEERRLEQLRAELDLENTPTISTKPNETRREENSDGPKGP